MPKNSPDALGVAHQQEAEALEVVHDVFAGTLRLREKAKKYLPRFTAEREDDYQARKGRAVLYNAYRRTVKGLVGMVFRKPTVLDDDVAELFREHAENIDLQGRALHVFARDVFEAAENDGHTHVLIDHTTVARDARSRAEERAMGSRPKWLHINKGDVLSFRTDEVDGKPELTQVVWQEWASEPDGEFGEKRVRHIRVLRLDGGRVEHRVYHPEGDDGEKADTLPSAPGSVAPKQTWRLAETFHLAEHITRIPWVTVYTGRQGFMRSDPPLLDLALENVKHFQIESRRDRALMLCDNPTPVFLGMDEETAEVVVGAQGITLPTDGNAFYLEPTGAGLGASRQQLQDCEKRMAILGLSMLMSEKRSAETATSKQIDKAESDSQLAAAAGDLRDALNNAYEWHMRWTGETDPRGEIGVNTDFSNIEISPQTVAVLADLVDRRMLSLDTLFGALEKGEILPDDFDPEIERERLAEGDLSILRELQERARAAEDDDGPDDEPEIDAAA